MFVSRAQCVRNSHNIPPPHTQDKYNTPTPLTRIKQDCWEEKNPPRDPATNELAGDHIRFSSGMKALGDYVHAAGLSFAMYTAESPLTCGGFPASANNEVLDAKTFASWGVDYLKASPRE